MAEKDIMEVARDVVADGTLDEQGVETILAAARERSVDRPLTTKERTEIMGIVRDRTTLEATRIAGLYPCGEGAGYAGGIMSAAIDGIRVAQAIDG